MKVVILAGGYGTRLSEETQSRPKPMVEIGDKPILWHIMKIYAHHGFEEFILALGYKADVVRSYFLDYHGRSGDIVVNTATGKVVAPTPRTESWTVHLIDTGQHTLTGGRLRRLRGLLGDEPFMLTYGDGVANVDIGGLLEFHRAAGRLATVTAVRPPARFGGIRFEDNLVVEFTEKSQIGEGWINGGFMILEPAIFNLLGSDQDVLEVDLLERLAERGQLAGFRHEGFWQCMDTLRDKYLLDRFWKEGKAPWKVWS